MNYPVIQIADTTTEQQVFDAVVKHLRTQNAKSEKTGDGGLCKYRTENNLACAVGCLMTDEQARQSDLEPSSRVSMSLFNKHAPQLLRFLRLLYDLQRIHDHYDVDEWEHQLQLFARFHPTVKLEPITPKV